MHLSTIMCRKKSLPHLRLHTCADQLARLDSVREVKLQHLEQQNRGITAFTHWVAENKARFKGEIYGPVLLEVTVKDAQHAKYLEMQLPRETLCSHTDCSYARQMLETHLRMTHVCPCDHILTVLTRGKCLRHILHDSLRAVSFPGV
jgi:hypothetical protein